GQALPRLILCSTGPGRSWGAEGSRHRRPRWGLGPGAGPQAPGWHRPSSASQKPRRPRHVPPRPPYGKVPGGRARCPTPPKAPTEETMKRLVLALTLLTLVQTFALGWLVYERVSGNTLSLRVPGWERPAEDDPDEQGVGGCGCGG